MEFWERHRREFPVTEKWIYLNHAAVAPLCRRAASAMQGSAEDACRNGPANYRHWEGTISALRASAARLIGASAGEIALVKNTTEGLSIVANGLDWRPGDVMVAVESEFPANYYPWWNLQKRGVQLRLAPQRGGTVALDDLDQACQGARLLAISFVQYLSGFRADLNAIGEICARRGCLLVVDAIQGLGVFPLDVRASRIHALCAGGHKWLTGPQGTGILYINSAIIPQIEPVEFGWTTVACWQDYQARGTTLREGAVRYECGGLNTAGCYGLLAAIDLLQEVGIDRIGERVAALARRMVTGLQAQGYEIFAPLADSSISGIVTFRKPGVDSTQTVHRLAGQGIVAAPRSGWIRASPHFYISEEEADRFLAALSA